MKNSKFNEIVKDQIETCVNMLIYKGEEYDASTDDRLHSFKVAATLNGETPRQALAGMMAKHTVSIYDMCNNGDYSIERWSEKITDSINYLLILRAMIEEENEI